MVTMGIIVGAAALLGCFMQAESGSGASGAASSTSPSGRVVSDQVENYWEFDYTGDPDVFCLNRAMMLREVMRDLQQVFASGLDPYLEQRLQHLQRFYYSGERNALFLLSLFDKYTEQHIAVLFKKVKVSGRHNILARFPFNVLPETFKDAVNRLQTLSDRKIPAALCNNASGGSSLAPPLPSFSAQGLVAVAGMVARRRHLHQHSRKRRICLLKTDMDRLFAYRPDPYLEKLLEHLHTSYRSSEIHKSFIAALLSAYNAKDVVVLFDKLKALGRDNILDEFPFNVLPKRLEDIVAGLRAWSEGTVLTQRFSQDFEVRC